MLSGTAPDAGLATVEALPPAESETQATGG